MDRIEENIKAITSNYASIEHTEHMYCCHCHHHHCVCLMNESYPNIAAGIDSSSSSNGHAVLRALKKLQEKIRHLESEKNSAEANFRQLHSKTKAFKDLISQQHFQDPRSGVQNYSSTIRPQDNLDQEPHTDNVHQSQQNPAPTVPNSIVSNHHPQDFASSKKAERINQTSFNDSSFPTEHYTSSSKLQSSQSRHQAHHDHVQSLRKSSNSHSHEETVGQDHAQSLARSENPQSHPETVSFEPGLRTNFDEALRRGRHYSSTQQCSSFPEETDNVRLNDSRYQQSHLRPSQNLVRAPDRSNTTSAANGCTNVDGSTNFKAPHHDSRIESDDHWSYQTAQEPIVRNPEESDSPLDFNHVPSNKDHRLGDSLPYPARDSASKKPSATSDLYLHSKTGNSSKLSQPSYFHSSGRMVPGSPNPVQLDHAGGQIPTLNSARKPTIKNRKALLKVASNPRRPARSPTRYENARAPEANILQPHDQTYPQDTDLTSVFDPDMIEERIRLLEAKFNKLRDGQHATQAQLEKLMAEIEAEKSKRSYFHSSYRPKSPKPTDARVTLPRPPFPFVVGKPNVRSFSLPVNIQKVLALLKNFHPSAFRLLEESRHKNSFLTAQDSITIARLEDELGQMAFDYEAVTTQAASSWNRKQLEKLSELMQNHAEKIAALRRKLRYERKTPLLRKESEDVGPNREALRQARIIQHSVKSTDLTWDSS